MTWGGRDVIEYYPLIRAVHIGCVAASGSLFTLRGLLVLAGRPAGNHPALRHLSSAIDTVLLTAALMLVGVLHLNPVRTPWLAAKLVLLVVYIVLGSFALKRARTPRGRALCFIAALAVFLTIVSIARSHQPWGWLATLQ